MRNILFIGDERFQPYVQALEDEGYGVTLLAAGAPFPSEGSFDIVLVHLSSAGEDAAIKRLLSGAAGQKAPVIIALIDEEQLSAFDPSLNLDDLLRVGAPAAELFARLRQALWKRSRLDAGNILKHGSLVMDLAGYTVQVAGRPVELTYKEYELLRFLATNPDRVFSREVLLNKVWGYDFYGGARTVDVHIRRLRSKIEDRHNTFIETVRNVGYRFRAS